mgnify:CR=1 FL=1
MTLLTNGANVNLRDTNGITPLRTRFFAANDPVPDPLPKPGFSKHPPVPSAPKVTVTRADSLPPELRPPALAGQQPLNNLLLLLLENGADPKIPDAKGNTILHALQPPPPDYNNPPLPKTALIPEATAHIRLLANYGLAPDTRSTNGLTPLHLAAARADLVHTFALLEAGAGVNTPDRQGRTALHHVLTPQMNPYGWQHEQETRRAITNTLALLLDNGADLRHADTNGATALHLLPAMDEALRDLVLPVLKTNRHFVAALRLRNKAGKTPVLMAFEQLRTNPVTHAIRTVTLLLEAGGELPAAAEKAGTTALHELAAIPSVGNNAQFARIFPDAAGTAALRRMVETMMEQARDLNVRDANGDTPLLIATRQTNTEFARALIRRGADVNATDKLGNTPLHLALQAIEPGGDSSFISLLVSNKCDIARRNAAGESPLRLEIIRRFYTGTLFLPPGATNGFFSAAYAGDLPSLDAYLSLDPTLATLKNPTTQVSALRTAAQAGQQKIAERLRNAGATDPLAAALLGWTNSLATFVHEAPRLAETSFGLGMPLLHLVAGRGQTASVRMLLTESVSPGMEDALGRSALFHATTNWSAELVAFLTARGVKLSVFDAISLADSVLLRTLLASEPALASATNRIGAGALPLATELGHRGVVEQLLARGADPNQASIGTPGKPHRFLGGTVPLHLAAVSNRTDLAELLLRSKASIRATNEQGYSALHFAVIGGHREMAKWLLARGANANAPVVTTNVARMNQNSSPYLTLQGYRPLHLAVHYGHAELVELLAAHGARLEATDASGRTPADLLQDRFGMFGLPYQPSPFAGFAPGPRPVIYHAQRQAVLEALKKLGAVISTTRGATFGGPGFPPGFRGPATIPGVPPGAVPAKKN